MQIVKKRALSSRRALLTTIENRLEALAKAEAREEAPSHAELRDYQADLPLTESQSERTARRILRSAIPKDEKRRRSELQSLKSIWARLKKLPDRDAKIEALLAELKCVFADDPAEKVIVFTEYRDTLEAIRARIDADPDLADHYVILHGGLTRGQRLRRQELFERPEIRVLLATDAASEGLNLQHHCRRVIHVELPWNPNRLEQRNGRVDRYGQSREPIIRFLYYPDSPEDDVLRRLVEKIEQMAADRVSTPDILGLIQGQQDFWQQLVRLDAEAGDAESGKQGLVRTFEDRTEQFVRDLQPLLLASGGSEDELRRILDALDTPEPLLPDDESFERLVLGMLGAKAATPVPGTEGIYRIEVPWAYRGEGVEAVYPAATFRRSVAARTRPEEVEYITLLHPLVRALAADARRRLLLVYPNVRGLPPRRLAARIVPASEVPSALFTWLGRIEGGGGLLEEHLLTIRVGLDGGILGAPEENLRWLEPDEAGEVPREALSSLFEGRFEALREAARAEAERWLAHRAEALRAHRRRQADILRQDLERDVRDRLRELDEEERHARGMIDSTGQQSLFAALEDHALPHAARSLGNTAISDQQRSQNSSKCPIPRHLGLWAPSSWCRRDMHDESEAPAQRPGFLFRLLSRQRFRRAPRPGRPPRRPRIEIAQARFRRIRERAEGRVADAVATRERFIRPLLRDVLGFHLGAGEERIHALFASAEAEQAGERPLLLVYCGEWDEDLDSGRGRANPMHRLGEALAQKRLCHGFLVTGERIRLIRATGDGPRGAFLEADLAGLYDEEDPEAFAAFIKLFAAATFLYADDEPPPIEAIERESRAHAERVSEDLKGSVFRAAESLVSGLIADAVARKVIASPLDLDERQLQAYRDAALLALYRLLFILYAEARDPRLDEHQLYRESYSATGLLEGILRTPSRAWPKNRCALWERLRALFRIYDQGLPPITPWEHIPPRGGDFFSRETPAGRILHEARLPDQQVARLILDLATTQPRRGVGRERVSFRELDIENLGAVYEGLLEYEPRIVRETCIEARVQGREYVLTPEELVRLCEQKNLVLKGDFAVVRGTAAEPLHPQAQDESADAEEDEPEEPDLDPEAAVEEPEAEEGAEDGLKRGGTARLLRRLEPGTFHFVPGPGRKGSGSFYTPRALVQDLVRHALGPLVAGKTAAEIERLRVLDPACGSAHFLVEAMRFLGQALHHAYVVEHGGKAPPEFRSTTGQRWDDNWRASDEAARAANSEARAWCKRRIAERCLFGVDLNPTAVELARVALWIESLAGDRPLTYFQHHIRCGNSLLGTWMARLEQPPLPGKEKKDQSQGFLPFQENIREAIREAARLRRFIDDARPEDLRREGIEPESTDEQRYKEHLRAKAEKTLAAARLLFDLRSASAFVPEIWHEWEKLTSLIDDPGRDPECLRAYAESQPWWQDFEKVRERERFFHWELEFPEVFLDGDRPGFDAILGNPPWDKILPNRHEFYGRYDILILAFTGSDLDRRIRELEAANPGLEGEFQAYRAHINTVAAMLKNGGDYRFHEWVIDGQRTGGHQDAFKFFVERAWQLAREGGRVGFVVPSAIYNNEGCTGLRHLLLEEAQIERFYAFENRKKIFPIHSSYKFVSLVFRKGRAEQDGFKAAFMRHDLAELDATARYREPGQEEEVKPSAAPWFVPVRRRELERLSPGTLAFLEYRSPRDREILLKMYGYDVEGNPVNPRPLLGDRGPGTWNARFYTEFNMTNDRDLWTDSKTGKLYNPRQILGPVPGTTSQPPYYDPAAWPEIRARMAEAGFWPLYEGKHIEQFLVDIRPIERWVSLEACQKKYGRLPDPGPKLVFRAIASNTNERTCIAAVQPERSCFGNSCWGTVLNRNDAEVLCSILNCFVADYAIRLRISANMNFTHVGRLAVLTPIEAYGLPTLATQSVAGDPIEHITEIDNVWPSIWLGNRAVAEAYGLTPDDFEYILSTFPVFARKRPEFYAYLQERVQEWKREVEGAKVYAISTAGLARAAETSEVYATKPARQPANPAFKQAAVLAWVVYKRYSRDYPVSRFRVQKMLYLIEAATETGLFTEFRKQAAGPYDPGLRYQGPEDIAVREKGWLVARDDTHFEPGPNIDEALGYAARYIDTRSAERVLEEFRNFDNETLERWTTVHLAAVELQRRGRSVTPEAILDYIQSVPEWQPKLSREAFTLDRVTDALNGLRKMSLLPHERRDIS